MPLVARATLLAPAHHKVPIVTADKGVPVAHPTAGQLGYRRGRQAGVDREAGGSAAEYVDNTAGWERGVR